jgi:hypothetical protein
MKNENMPTEGQNSTKLETESALCGATCSSSVFDAPPLHMDTASRNARLYKTLLEMGLFVEPVKDSCGGISKFIVSCGINGITHQVATFAEWYESKIGITLEQAKRAGVYDLALLEDAFNFVPNVKVV